MKPAYSTVPMGGQQYGQPGAPQYGQPGAPQYGQPGAPQYGQPGAPQYGQPGAQQYGQPGAPQYGQPGAPQYGQPGAPQYGQPGAQQYGQYGAEPVYKQISCGQGIDQNEFQSIVECCKQAYLSRMTPLSEHCTNAIKQRLGGDWFVFQCDMENTDFDFHLTKVKGGDYLTFSLDNKKFEVCRLR